MGLQPEKVNYLARAGTMLGHVEAPKIQQLGEAVKSVRTPFAVLPEVARLVRVIPTLGFLVFGTGTALRHWGVSSCCKV